MQIIGSNVIVTGGASGIRKGLCGLRVPGSRQRRGGRPRSRVDTPMAPEFGTVLFEPLTVADVVDATVAAGIEDGGFLIPVGPGVVEAFQAKASDYDGFLTTMQGRVQSLPDSD